MDKYGNVFEKISEEYYNLTASEKKVADYLLSHQSKSQHLSISQLRGRSGGGGYSLPLLQEAGLQGL